MWREDFDKLKIGPLADGAQVVVAGGCDYYPGSRTASPSFSFAVTRLRVAGEGDLLAQLDQLRKRLHAEGLFAPQKQLPRPRLPKCIGVVTGESGKARDDVLAGLKPPRLGGPRGVGLRARAGPARGAGDHAQAAGPGGVRGGRGDRGGARRRVARGPVRVLRRDPVPDGRAAARAGDLERRPPHGPDAARRRRGRRVLDADPRRRDRRAGRLHGGPRATRPHHVSPAPPGPPRGARARPRALTPVPRARPPRRPSPHAPAPAAP